MEDKFTTYKYKGIYGVTDLKDTNPYNDWGDFIARDITEEEYLKNPKKYIDKVERSNSKYISKLIKENKYKQEYTIDVTLKHNPLFDDVKLPTSSTKSCRVVFLDFVEYGK